MAARWGSRIKMGEGPEYLCADENDAGERELRIQEGGRISGVRSLIGERGRKWWLASARSMDLYVY